jgi:hypothetical protein
MLEVGCEMSSTLIAYLRNSGRQYLLYLSVGLAAIPVGIAYGILVLRGYDHWWTLLACVAFGSWIALKLRQFVGKKLPQSGYGSTSLARVSVYVELGKQAGSASMPPFLAHNEGLALIANFAAGRNAAPDTRIPIDPQSVGNERMAEPYVFAGR